MFKKVAMITVSICAGLSLQACTDDEVATGAVIVGAVVIGAAIAAGASGGGGSVDHGRQDYGRGDHRGGGRGGRHLADLNVAQDARVIALTQKYSLSTTASKKVMSAFDSAQEGKLDGFTTVGLSKDELQQLGVGMVPSAQTIARVSANLKTSPASLQYFLQDVADQAVVESSKWMTQGTGTGN